MGSILKAALLVAASAFIVSLVFTKLPVETLNPYSSEGSTTTAPTTSANAPAAPQPAPRVPTIVIGGTVVRVDIAKTPAERQKGLSGRPGLAPDEGMLFIFEQSGEYSFWMKDMLFSIDIVWLSEEGAIVHIAHDVAPETFPASFSSKTPARFVLELPAGFSQAYNLKIGDHAQLTGAL